MKHLILVFAFLLGFSPVVAQEVSQGTGLVCDTAEQVELFITQHNAGIKNADNFALINKDKEVCMILTAAFYRGETVKRVMADGLVYEIAPILVVGMYAGQWIHVSPNTVFSIFRSKDRGA